MAFFATARRSAKRILKAVVDVLEQACYRVRTAVSNGSEDNEPVDLQHNYHVEK